LEGRDKINRPPIGAKPKEGLPLTKFCMDCFKIFVEQKMTREWAEAFSD
jgi:hypothetical protein